jgi:hydrogenase 3 maturation protease
MSPSSWRTSLNQLLSRQTPKPHIAIVGIGNTFRSDDAAGILVARTLMDSRLIRDLKTILVMDAGHAPENFTGDLRHFTPDVILLIDAAEMGEMPGTTRWLEMDELEGMSASTHTMPLSMLAEYLTFERSGYVALIGVQPKSNDVGETTSAEVAAAVNKVVEGLIDSISGF